MKKDEFVSQFEDIIKDPTDLVKVSKFRDAVIADYDAHELLATSSATLTEKYNELEEANKKLKETNLQLFMMSPAMSTGGNPAATGASPSDDNSDKGNPTTHTVDDIINGLLGNEKEKK